MRLGTEAEIAARVLLTLDELIDVTATATLTQPGPLSPINIAIVARMMVYNLYSAVAQIVLKTSPGRRGIWTGVDIGIGMIADEMIA